MISLKHLKSFSTRKSGRGEEVSAVCSVWIQGSLSQSEGLAVQGRDGRSFYTRGANSLALSASSLGNFTAPPLCLH